MAGKQEQKTPAGRIALLAALLAMEVSAASAFGRVLLGRWPTVRLALAAGLSVLLAGVLERRHVLLAMLISAAAFVALAGLMVFPETTAFGFPTATTLRAMRAAFAAVGRTADVQSAPALPLPPLMLAALTGAWAAAFSSHALAARARSPFLSVVPPAALIAFTNLVMKDGVRPMYVVPFLASVIALLFADGLWRLGQWGPITMWHGRRSARLPTTTTRGARRVAAACLGIALIAPGILPGFRSPGLVDVQGSQQTARVSINPIVDIRAQLLSNPDRKVFTVQTDPPRQGAYWRFAADDVFNGRQWSPSDPAVSRGAIIDGGSTQLPQVDASSFSSVLRQHFEFQQYYQPQLPAAFQPIAVNVGGERVRYDPTAGVLFDENGTHPGFSYDVTSGESNPGSDALDAVASFDSLGGSALSYYTKLPTDTPREIAAIAHRVADSASSPYRKVLAIQDYLKITGGFSYSVRVPPGHSTNDILRFLTETKAGFCEQFAGSMAVLLRAIGIPTRVAVGFTAGVYDSRAGVWRVTSQDAHAWVEVLFPGFGWLAFEPTPGRTNPVASYTNPPPSQATSQPAPASTTICRRIQVDGQPLQRACASSPLPQGTQDPGVSRRLAGEVGPQRGAANAGRTTPLGISARRLIVVGLLLLLALMVLSIPAVKVVTRRLRVFRSSEPRARILAQYAVLSQQAADVGWGRGPAETLLEYRARLKQGMSLDGDLDRLTELANRAAYAETITAAEAADHAGESARRLAHQIRKSAGVGKSLAGWFRVDLSSRR